MRSRGGFGAARSFDRGNLREGVAADGTELTVGRAFLWSCDAILELLNLRTAEATSAGVAIPKNGHVNLIVLKAQLFNEWWGRLCYQPCRGRPLAVVVEHAASSIQHAPQPSALMHSWGNDPLTTGRRLWGFSAFRHHSCASWDTTRHVLDQQVERPALQHLPLTHLNTPNASAAGCCCNQKP
jgi:hypothetical protein